MNDPREMDTEEALGLAGLRDVDAALSCMCSCHARKFGRPTHVRPDGTSPYDPGGPLAGQQSLHDDGASCPCQQTPEQRQAAVESLFAALSEEADSPERQFSNRADARDLELADDRAARLGFDHLRRTSQACPFVIEGAHRGREVFLRERHGSWRLELDGEVIARGADEDLFGDDGWAADHAAGLAHLRGPVQRTVEVIAEAIARHDARVGCPHRGARSFCPDCGTWTDVLTR